MVTGGEDDDKTEGLPASVKLVFDEGKGAANYTDTMAFAVHKIYPDQKNKTERQAQLLR